MKCALSLPQISALIPQRIALELQVFHRTSPPQPQAVKLSLPAEITLKISRRPCSASKSNMENKHHHKRLPGRLEEVMDSRVQVNGATIDDFVHRSSVDFLLYFQKCRKNEGNWQ